MAKTVRRQLEGRHLLLGQSHSANVLRVDDPRSEPRALQNKMAKDAESDIAILLVDENDYGEISAKAVSAKTEIKKESPFLSGIELTVQQGNP